MNSLIKTKDVEVQTQIKVPSVLVGVIPSE